MKKRTKFLFNALMVLTIFVPTSLYVYITATIFKVEPDYIIQNANIGDLRLLNNDDDYFIVSDEPSAVFAGTVVYNADLDTYVLLVDLGEVIKIDKTYYNITEDGFNELDLKKLKEEAKTSNGVTAATIIALAIVAVIIIRKLNLGKQYPRIAVMISLLIGTGVLYGLNTIIRDMLYVFVAATASWAVYLIEYTVYFNKLSDNERARIISRLERNGK